ISDHHSHYEELKIKYGGGPKNNPETQALWYVSIKEKFSKTICGGSLCIDNTVITAAKCVDKFDKEPENISALVYGKNLEGTKISEFNVSAILVHENFTNEIYYSDIAVLCLDTNGSDIEGSKAVRLPTSNLSLNFNFSEIVGWGETNNGSYFPKMRTVTFLTLPSSVCNEWCKALVRNDNLTCISEEKFCTLGYFRLSNAACMENPLCLRKTSDHIEDDCELIGIQVLGPPCFKRRRRRYFPDMYTKVSFYLDWIEEAVEECSAY
ncbi:chymotrypsin-1-like, partial [Convolutriloba macropyga]|uniref:chymotrypsin-1-like n=1 Tax=Convolutriloba macropyga TaxID=536237 RepID=UPI003F52293C